MKSQEQTLEISAKTIESRTVFILREKHTHALPLSQQKPDFMSKSCQYCPNEGDFLDSTEKRLHFLSQWHKTNVKRSYYGLCSLKYSEFTLLPVKAFLLQNESLPSFPHLPMQQDDSEADFVNLNSDSWIRFLNSFASTHETVNPLSQFPERVCVHRSLFSTEKCETISQEVIVATADKISTYIDLAFTFIYITAEE
ncbi:hypothetical protein DI09_186p20 [Mitosporidium daphniae]|uniref:Uncharacterized protein n=1 Tax=Mitosporidium daphniae TaxID=1485682 RepID=A0A098VTR2_9MICR|nr:uncharacterized protein DI09_186p20 [Mitosporidium daphniae]KGG52342.1 hypothetical protein DI09_186p20 [Mitosporidium daphniae]|eukprot:XP_013238778.1 uncharacterized protein DI09_186p20 [Mitosporidium daphniae]